MRQRKIKKVNTLLYMELDDPTPVTSGASLFSGRDLQECFTLRVNLCRNGELPNGLETVAASDSNGLWNLYPNGQSQYWNPPCKTQ